MISFLECNTFVCERYGHLNRTHYLRMTPTIMPAAALAAGVNMFCHRATPSDR